MEAAATLTSSLSKAQKAALIFLLLEEKGAASLFQKMSDKEIKAVGTTLLKMEEIPLEDMATILNEFYETVGVPVSDQVTGKRIFERLVEKTVPKDRRGRIFSIDEIKGGKDSKHNSLEPLFASLTGQQAFDLISSEHPQTTSVILTMLKPALSRQVIGLFNSEQQTDLIQRMAALQKIPEKMIQLLSVSYKEKIAKASTGSAGQSQKSGSVDIAGIDLALRYLRSLEWAKAEELLGQIEQSDQITAAELRKRIFTMEDLLRTDNNGIRNLLKNIETTVLSVALKKSSVGVQNKVYQNMSTRAATLMKEDIESMADPKPEDAEVAISKILDAAKTLIQSGEIVLAALEDN